MKRQRLNIELIAKHLTDETDNKEKQMITKIINDDEQSRKDFEAYLDVWEKSADLKELEKVNAKDDWKVVRSKMNFKGKSRKISFKTYFIRIAAIFILAFGMAYLFKYFISTTKNNQVDYYETSSLNNTKDVQLPDGSIISLNRNSKIITNTDFGKTNRDIILEGEAFFKVSKNKNLPFRVYSMNSTVEVMGTSFNIKSDSAQVIVGVFTGKVAFYQTGNSINGIELTPENTGFYQANSNLFKYQATLDSNIVSWYTGKLIFRRTPVKEVIQAIASSFDKELFIEPGVSINDTINYINFDKNKESLQEMIEAINLTRTEKLNIRTYDTRLIVRNY